MEFATEGFKHESFLISKGASSLPSYDSVPFFYLKPLWFQDRGAEKQH